MESMTGIQTPCMDWDSVDLPDAWEKFEQQAELMFRGPLKDLDESQKCAYLLLWVGNSGRDAFNIWTMTSDEKKCLDALYKRFRAYVQPEHNPLVARFKFNREMQGTRKIEQYVAKLKLLARDCEYPDPDEMIRDHIVVGTNSEKVREMLLDEGDDLTLERAIQIAQSYECSQEQIQSIQQMLFLQ